MNSSGTVHKIYKLDCRRWKYLTFIFLFDVTCVVDSHPTVTDLNQIAIESRWQHCPNICSVAAQFAQLAIRTFLTNLIGAKTGTQVCLLLGRSRKFVFESSLTFLISRTTRVFIG